MNKFLIFAAVSMAIAVIFGALGAHALKNSLDQASIASWNTGVLYQIIHSLAIMLIFLIAKQNNFDVNGIMWFMIFGIFAFSGSIYLLTLNKVWNISDSVRFLGPITPIGGMAFISAWFWLAMKIFKLK
jgi:uncharacterized membrane protein YgdD (TMEM256/DUF423 family)